MKEDFLEYSPNTIGLQDLQKCILHNQWGESVNAG